MDTRTGQIHQLREAETVEDLRRRLGAGPKDLVMLDKLPEGTCRLAAEFIGWGDLGDYRRDPRRQLLVCYEITDEGERELEPEP